MLSNAKAFKPYGLLGQRASLRGAHAMDASLQLSRLQLEDGGRYRCELINGIEDENIIITLRIEGNSSNYQYLLLNVYFQHIPLVPKQNVFYICQLYPGVNAVKFVPEMCSGAILYQGLT